MTREARHRQGSVAVASGRNEMIVMASVLLAVGSGFDVLAFAIREGSVPKSPAEVLRINGVSGAKLVRLL